MNNKNLEKFSKLLEELQLFPKDELRDYYLLPAMEMVDNYEITNKLYNGNTALMLVVHKSIQKNHWIRQNNLNKLIWKIAEKTPLKYINYQDEEGNSVAHYICHTETFSVGVLDLMNELGLNYSQPNKNGDIPLMLVANSDILDTLKYIHSYTDRRVINSRNNQGHTAIYNAIKGKKTTNIFYLLENGCDILGTYDDGITLLDLVYSKEYCQYMKKELCDEIKSIVKMFTEKQTAEKNIQRLVDIQKGIK